MERHRHVERSLSAQRRQNRVGAFLGDDLLDVLGGYRLDVSGIRKVRVGHDGRRVGVDEDDAEALFAQDPTCLCPRVVKLAGLADHDWTGTNHQNRGNVTAARHQASFPATSMSTNLSKR